MTFPTFRFPSTIHKKIFKILANKTRKPPKTTIKKTTGKKNAKIDKQYKFGLPTGPRGGPNSSVFDICSCPGVPGILLGRPWWPKWSQTSPKSLRDPPGPQFVMIFTQFLIPFLKDFLVLGPIPGTVAEIGPQGNWISQCRIRTNVSLTTRIFVI